MTELGATSLAWAADFAYWALIAAFALSFIRLIRGPSLPDRIVALDLMTVLAAAFILVLAVDGSQDRFIDVAIALGLVSFLATVGFARYVMRRGLSRRDKDDNPDPADNSESTSNGREAPDA